MGNCNLVHILSRGVTEAGFSAANMKLETFLSLNEGGEGLIKSASATSQILATIHEYLEAQSWRVVSLGCVPETDATWCVESQF